MQLGNSPINWSNEDLHELGGDVPVERCLAEMAEAGFVGTEYGYKFPDAPADVQRLLGDHGLALASSWHSVYFVDGDAEEELRRLDAKAAFLAAAGAAHVNLCDVSRTVHTVPDAPLSTRPIFTDAEWDRLAAGLNRAGEVCRRHRVVPAYHPHMGTGVQTLAETDRLMDMTDATRVWLCPDSGHAAYAGDDAHALFARHADRIAHVHFKDVRPDALADAIRRDSPFLTAVVDGVFTVPGDGLIDFAPLVAALRRARYDGWVIVEAEQYLPGTDPYAFARDTHRYLTALLEGA